jgi:hypothetical protein
MTLPKPPQFKIKLNTLCGCSKILDAVFNELPKDYLVALPLIGIAIKRYASPADKTIRRFRRFKRDFNDFDVSRLKEDNIIIWDFYEEGEDDE